jgi:hypothetical protein
MRFTGCRNSTAAQGALLPRCLFRELLLLLHCAAAASPCSDDLHQELHDCTESEGSNIHINYIKARNMMSQ